MANYFDIAQSITTWLFMKNNKKNYLLVLRFIK